MKCIKSRLFASYPKDCMRKSLILLFFFVLSAQAQKMSRNNDIAMADTTAPIGLDLMAGKKSGVTVFPNESNDHILVSVSGKAADKKAIVIYNSYGQPVFRSGTCYENTYLVDVSGLRKDLYIVEVSSGANVYRKKWYRN